MKWKKLKKRGFLIISVLLVFFSASSFRVSPVRLDLKIARGQTKEITLELSGSKGAKIENLIVYATDITMNRNGSLIFQRLKSSGHSAVSWFKFEQKEFRLLEKQSKKLKFKIRVPRTTKPGEYYAVVMVEPAEFSSLRLRDKPVLIKMKSRVAVVFIINVPGRIYEKKGEAIFVKAKESKGKIIITSTFKNAGNIHLDVLGTATIQSADRRTTFGKVKLNSPGRKSKEKEFVFPNSKLDFTGVLDKPLTKGDYIVDVAFDYGYKFRKARKKAYFSIHRKANIDESKVKLLSVEPKEIKIELPKGAFRVKPIKLVNLDYRTMKVSIKTDAKWIKISPPNITLKPGENKVLKVILSIPNNKKNKRFGKIIFKPNRGKLINFSVKVMRPELLSLSETAKKKVIQKPLLVKKRKSETVKNKKTEQKEKLVKAKIVKPQEKLTKKTKPTLKSQKNNYTTSKKLFGLVILSLIIIILLTYFLAKIIRKNR